MRLVRHLPLMFAVLCAAGGVAAQDSEWLSYRDAYRAMVAFEKYGKPKNLIQNHFQVAPKEKGASLDGVQLALNGKSVHLILPLDATGRAVFPLSKAAYDENAELVLNRKLAQYALHPRVSIVVRPDGVYELAELRSACEQALEFQKTLDWAYRTRKCVGVRLAFARKGEPVVHLRTGATESALAAQDGPAFGDDAQDGFKVVLVKFADAAKGQVVTPSAPLAIAPQFE